jgi:branched-chain amino acid transport system ATP-binding protein
MQLSATSVGVRFAGVQAIDRLSLTLGRGEVLGLVGPNGAGKTTLVNVLSGFQPPHEGRVELDGAEVTGRDSAWLARNGVVRTFQAVRLFKGLLVSENVEASLAALGEPSRGCAATRTRDARLPWDRRLRRAARRRAQLRRRAAGGHRSRACSVATFSSPR